MTDLILSVLTGGATGIIGTVASGLLGFFNQRQKQSHELALRRLDNETMDKEAAWAVRQEEVRAEGVETAAEWEGLKASYAEASVRWSQGMPLTRGQSWAMVMVDVVRGLMRPVLTTGLVVMVGITYYHTDGTEGIQLEERIVATILYLATAAVLWWFGSRQVDKALR